MKGRLLMTALGLAAVALGSAQRMPTVTCTAEGLPGSWVLNFTLQNNFNPGEGSIYFFGVWLETGTNIVGLPTAWDDRWAEWSNLDYGGSPIVYNNNWIALTENKIPEGGSLSGFRARTTAEFLPETIPWFAFASGGTYEGNDHFYLDINPGFEGIAAVPEPASVAALGLGLAALLRRRRR